MTITDAEQWTKAFYGKEDGANTDLSSGWDF